MPRKTRNLTNSLKQKKKRSSKRQQARDTNSSWLMMMRMMITLRRTIVRASLDLVTTKWKLQRLLIQWLIALLKLNRRISLCRNPTASLKWRQNSQSSNLKNLIIAIVDSIMTVSPFSLSEARASRSRRKSQLRLRVAQKKSTVTTRMITQKLFRTTLPSTPYQMRNPR